MFVSHLDTCRTRHVHTPRQGTLTMRAYFDAFQVDGRAVLRGTPEHPLIWIAQLGGHLVVCASEAISARRVADMDKVPGFAVYDTRPEQVH